MPSPDRNVNGAETGMAAPFSLALGRATDVLFVTDPRQHGVLVYDGVSRDDFDRNVPPSRAFWMQNYDLQPVSATYDEGRDMLYVIEANLNKILVVPRCGHAQRRLHLDPDHRSHQWLGGVHERFSGCGQ